MLPQSLLDNSSTNRGTLSGTLITEQLLRTDGVQRMTPCRRATVLYRVGDTATHVYFLESGLAKILREGGDGRELLITIVRGGELFGEESMFDDSRREMSAEMLSDGAVYAIPAATLVQACRDTPQFWEQIAAFLDRRKRALERKLDLLFLRDVEQRILQTLVELSGIYGGPEGRFTVQLSQSEMANLIGATRETTSTTLNAMARRGVLTLGRRIITVPSLETLLAALRQPEAAREAEIITAGAQ
ncbi:MAG: Crp/Fnr family transcriptional regulator [Acidobacteria bacterium]|nr:Crp/Fnr family transcriptional regulator [Acidobacteriota bacterium]